jgi:hypothetical protein
MSIFSSSQELEQIERFLVSYAKLPMITDTIPGAVMEAVLAHVRSAKVLQTYDFVDVVDVEKGIGWQVKSTKASTPVTWKRAKIPNADILISASFESKKGLQELGNAILSFCNEHVAESVEKYHLTQIGYARLVVEGEVVRYFERMLHDKTTPILFHPEDFEWRWSTRKEVKKKEQLQALHGIHKATGKKWWAWHGLGENQLHFSGETTWWPAQDSQHARVFQFPMTKLSIEEFIELLDSLTPPLDQANSQPRLL